MSRIGKKPIKVPMDVTVSFKENSLNIRGPKGELNLDIHPEIAVEIVGKDILLKRKSENLQNRAFHGLMWSLISNMMEGVSKGFEKELEMSGVGYKATKEGRYLILSVGFSHPVRFEIPQGIEIIIEDQNIIKITGIDKQLVGKVAAEIRATKPCEPYKGKGIKYKDEVVRRKAGKALKAGKPA